MVIKKKIKSDNNGDYELYEYIFNTQNEQLEYPYSEEEELIRFSTGTDKKYYATVKKWNNFISKVRALNKEYEIKPFSQKYPFLAREIRKAAEYGQRQYTNELSVDEIEALRAEGFNVQTKKYFNKSSTISW